MSCQCPLSISYCMCPSTTLTFFTLRPTFLSGLLRMALNHLRCALQASDIFPLCPHWPFSLYRSSQCQKDLSSNHDFQDSYLPLRKTMITPNENMYSHFHIASFQHGSFYCRLILNLNSLHTCLFFKEDEEDISLKRSSSI